MYGPTRRMPLSRSMRHIGAPPLHGLATGPSPAPAASIRFGGGGGGGGGDGRDGRDGRDAHHRAELELLSSSTKRPGLGPVAWPAR